MARHDHVNEVVALVGCLYMRVGQADECEFASAPPGFELTPPDAGWVGAHLPRLLSPDAPDAVVDAFARARHGHLLGVIELSHPAAPSGLEMAAVATGDDSLAVVVVVADARSRVLHESLTAMGRRLRGVINGLSSGVNVLRLSDGKELVLVEANPAADTVLGKEHDSLLGLSVEEAFPELERMGMTRILLSIAREGGEFRNARYPVPACGGGRTFDLHAFQSCPDEVTVVFADVTESSRNEDREAAHRAALKTLAAQLAQVDDDERRRLAVDLHDRVSQALAVSLMLLRQAKEDLSAPRASDDLAGAIELLDSAIAETRSLTTDLFPPVLYELGLPSALTWLCEESERMYGVTCHMDMELEAGFKVDDGRKVVLFRAAQTLLRSIAHRHDGVVGIQLIRDAGGVVLRLASSASLQLWEGDDADVPRLLGVRERVEHLGGSLQLAADDETGAVVELSMPVD